MFSLAFLATFFCVGWSFDANSSDCVFSIANANWTLNLSSLAGKQFEVKQEEYLYYLTLCSNKLECRGKTNDLVMATQVHEGQDDCEAYLAFFNDSVVPTYSYYYDGYRFEYANGENCGPGNPRILRLYITCDPEATEARVEFADEDSPCEYTIEIKTADACSSPKNYGCKYHDPSGNYTLDLSDLKNQTFTYFNQNEGRTYSYSVCHDNVNCTEGEETGSVMAAMFTGNTTDTCKQYLAIWDNGENDPILQQNNNGGYWQFAYVNGQPCGEGAPGQQFDIDWVCDNSTDGTVEYAGEYDPCKFEMRIQTKHACV